MKIAVYTIALNEEKHVERWHESAKDADYLLIADTGSTDRTVKIAKKLGIKIINISINPWRFDDARNAALAALPKDIDMCISLDMDEVLSEGWRKKLESIDEDTTMVSYKYTWSWRDPISRTQPQTIYIFNKVHARHGYRWNYLVHELPLPDRNEKHKEQALEGFEIYHYYDIEKSRNQYNELIDAAFEETKEIQRYWIYKMGNLVLKNDKKQAKEFIYEFLKKFKGEIAIPQLATAYQMLAICDPKNRKKHLLMSHKIYPQRREYLVALSVYYFKQGKLRKAKYWSEKALKITVRQLDQYYGEYAWGYLPKNIIYVCKHNLKLNKWFKLHNQNKLDLNVDSMIASSFDLYKQEDVV
jgi:glycosyltransferase involved in cell wall biosynthesis